MSKRRKQHGRKIGSLRVLQAEIDDANQQLDAIRVSAD
jgi:hypothetical protein